MVDRTGDLVDGMQAMRIRNAILITALRRLGGSIEVTHGDAYDSAAFDVQVKREPGKMVISLQPAPTS